jgi:quinate dehydrogenase
MSVQQITFSPTGDSLQTNQVSQLGRHGYLFGKKLTASLSPFLHDVIYKALGYNWGQVRLDSADIEGFLQLAQHPDFYGTSLTHTHQLLLTPYRRLSNYAQ